MALLLRRNGHLRRRHHSSLNRNLNLWSSTLRRFTISMHRCVVVLNSELPLNPRVIQADGDLSFKVGDRIEIVKKTESQEDWWTGRLNGMEGVFPGNYVQG